MKTPSLFSYPVTRQYPPRFTWIICLGGVALTAFFTFIAVAINAYQVDPVYATDPNFTEIEKNWFQGAAFSWANDLENKCQPTLLTVGSDHMTTNRGFLYTIGGFHVDGSPENVSFTADYKNSPLEDCNVQEIEINFLRRDQTPKPEDQQWSWEATYARSTTACLVYTEFGGTLRVNFTHQLPPVLRRSEIEDTFSAINHSLHSGRYFGAQIAARWYVNLAVGMGWSVPVDSTGTEISDHSWGSGVVTLRRNQNETNYESSEFFLCEVNFSGNNGELNTLKSSRTIKTWKDQWDQATLHRLHFQHSPGLPNISTIVDAFGKSYYSLLLSDFNSIDQIQKTNALSTEKGLKYLSSIISEEHASNISDFKFPTTADFTQPLPSPEHTTLILQYLCSKPVRKNIFKLIFSVVQVDIVFLGACWTIFGWIAAWRLGRRDSITEHCVGCLNAAADVPLTPLSPSPAKGGSYSRVSNVTGEENGGSEERLSVPYLTRAGSRA